MLEQAHIKLSSVVSDLLSLSGRRMLQVLLEGETNAAALAALADPWLRASQEQLRDLLGACSQLNRVFRRLLKMTLEELALLERHMNKFDKEISALLKQHQKRYSGWPK